jgi:hypothetical protein
MSLYSRLYFASHSVPTSVLLLAVTCPVVVFSVPSEWNILKWATAAFISVETHHIYHSVDAMLYMRLAL